jgi:hypothetical protein
MHTERFEPVYLQPEGAARLTEYGKRFMSRRLEQLDKCWPVLHDIIKLAISEELKWPAIQAALAIEGVPTNISSGLSGYWMNNLLPFATGKTTFSVPTTVTMAMTTGAAPTVTTTGACGDNAGQYTSYARLTLTNANWSAVSGTNPCAMTYSTAGAVTFAACTGSTATETGFVICDNATLNTGNAYWYGTLTSVVISLTQTPPTLAQNALTVSFNGT